jgi:hypothetical protein
MTKICWYPPLDFSNVRKSMQTNSTDQGTNFESKVIKELCQLTDMKKSRTTSYHPMGMACAKGSTEQYVLAS